MVWPPDCCFGELLLPWLRVLIVDRSITAGAAHSEVSMPQDRDRIRNVAHLTGLSHVNQLDVVGVAIAQRTGEPFFICSDHDLP